MRFLLAVALLLAEAWLHNHHAQAGWGSGGCAPVGAFAGSIYQAVPTPRNGWRATTDGTYALFRNDVQIAWYDAWKREYRTYDADRDEYSAAVPYTAPPWEGGQPDTGALKKVPETPETSALPPAERKKCDCCKDCPCKGTCKCKDTGGKGCADDCKHKKAAEAATERPLPAWAKNGVVRDEVPTSENYWLNGKKVERTRAAEALGDNQLIDDSTKGRVTILDPDPAKRQKVVDDMAKAPELAPYRDKFLVQAYAPEHWAPKGVGLVCDASPTIYVQGPPRKNGEAGVVDHEHGYGGPGQLAQALDGALRKVDPNYHPDRDPDLTHGGGGTVGNQTLLFLVLGGLIILAVASMRPNP